MALGNTARTRVPACPGVLAFGLGSAMPRCRRMPAARRMPAGRRTRAGRARSCGDQVLPSCARDVLLAVVPSCGGGGGRESFADPCRCGRRTLASNHVSECLAAGAVTGAASAAAANPLAAEASPSSSCGLRSDGRWLPAPLANVRVPVRDSHRERRSAARSRSDLSEVDTKPPTGQPSSHVAARLRRGLSVGVADDALRCARD